MGRYSPGRSYGHKCLPLGDTAYSISWAIDRYYPDSRLRHPTRYTRFTDKAGAERFCKKHGITMTVKTAFT